MLARIWRKGNPPTLLVGMRISLTMWKAVWKFLKKLKIEIPFDPGIPLLGIYPKNAGAQFEKDICTPMFIKALLTIAKKWK